MMEDKDCDNDPKPPDPTTDAFPPEPIKPLDSECCGTGCIPCVFDIYEKQCSEWKLQCNAIRKGTFYEKPVGNNVFVTPEKYKLLKIQKIFNETENMKLFRFSWPGESMEFPVKLGQHLLLKCDGVSRQYSILKTDSELCYFDILIKIYSRPIPPEEEVKMLTPMLDDLKEGDQVMARGPFGRVFEYNPKMCSNLFLIAAGTGIAPMCRIIETVLNNEEDETRIKLIFSCSTIQDIPLSNQFKKWSSFWNFDVTYFIPSYDPTGQDQSASLLPYYGMKIINQRLDLEELRDQIPVHNRCQLDTSVFVICGTKPFEKDVINHLSKIGVDSSKMILF